MRMADLYLAHHGIKGMKWGVRRFQNDDGTLTSAGKKRYKEETVIKPRRKKKKGRFKEFVKNAAEGSAAVAMDNAKRFVKGIEKHQEAAIMTYTMAAGTALYWKLAGIRTSDIFSGFQVMRNKHYNNRVFNHHGRKGDLEGWIT